jgi:hypothetical protein
MFSGLFPDFFLICPATHFVAPKELGNAALTASSVVRTCNCVSRRKSCAHATHTSSTTRQRQRPSFTGVRRALLRAAGARRAASVRQSFTLMPPYVATGGADAIVRLLEVFVWESIGRARIVGQLDIEEVFR